MGAEGALTRHSRRGPGIGISARRSRRFFAARRRLPTNQPQFKLDRDGWVFTVSAMRRW